jgi:D-ribulokinase
MSGPSVALGIDLGTSGIRAALVAASGDPIALHRAPFAPERSEVPLFAPEYGVCSHRLGERGLAGGASNSGGAALAGHSGPEEVARLGALIDPKRPSRPGAGERFPIADPALASRTAPRPADDAAFRHGLLEGIARIEVMGYRRLRDLGGPALASLRSVGGGARNPIWSALRARVLGVPLGASGAQQAAFGAAMLALRAVA